MIPTSEKDFLENDPPIRGQNFVCLSFLHPEQLLKRKETFFFSEYTKAFVEDAKELLNKMREEYPDKNAFFDTLTDNHKGLFGGSMDLDYQYFLDMKQDELEKRFNQENDFQTSTQGIKVRGVFESSQEAQNQCQKLRKIDNEKFNIYIAEVGCWCPWNPNPNAVENQEFAETELNTLMSKYKENMDTASSFYKERKEVMQKRIEEEQKQNMDDANKVDVEENTESLEEEIGEDDPWIKNKARLLENQTEELKIDQ